jgi:hypothetical protein
VSRPALLDDELHPLLRERRDQRALPRWYRRGAYDEFGVLSTILMGNANLSQESSAKIPSESCSASLFWPPPGVCALLA